MFRRFDVNPVLGVKWVTALLIALGMVETRLHWAAFASGDDAGLVVLWFVVACVGIAFGAGLALRLAKGWRAREGAGSGRVLAKTDE